MAGRVKLKDVIDALDAQDRDMTTYFDRVSGEIIPIPGDLGLLPDEAQEEASTIADDESGRYVALSDSFDLNEWQIMANFCSTLQPQLREEFEREIRGRGAFRAFKNALLRHDLEDKWYDFKRARLAEIAREWSEDNDIAVEE